jgi:hypothetical protein
VDDHHDPVGIVVLPSDSNECTLWPKATANGERSTDSRVDINGTSSPPQVWLDGKLISPLSRTVNLGTLPITQFQIGQVMSGGTCNVIYEEAAFDTMLLP